MDADNGSDLEEVNLGLTIDKPSTALNEDLGGWVTADASPVAAQDSLSSKDDDSAAVPEVRMQR